MCDEFHICVFTGFSHFRHYEIIDRRVTDGLNQNLHELRFKIRQVRIDQHFAIQLP